MRTPLVLGAAVLLAALSSTGCRGDHPADALPTPPDAPARAAAGARVDVVPAARHEPLVIPPDPFGAPPGGTVVPAPEVAPTNRPGPPSGGPNPTYL